MTLIFREALMDSAARPSDPEATKKTEAIVAVIGDRFDVIIQISSSSGR